MGLDAIADSIRRAAHDSFTRSGQDLQLGALRPTASPTVFAQQLGRGLRRAEGKSHLTVIDLIGQHRREFRFDERLRAIVDTRRGRIVDQVEAGFPFLPAGCTLDLDRQSRKIVLDNLRAAVRRSRWTTLVDDLRALPEAPRLVDFIERHNHRLEDVYRGERNWTQLQRDAGRLTPEPTDAGFEARTLRTLGRLTHIDDPERVSLYRELLMAEAPPKESDLSERHRRLLTMLAWGLGSGGSDAAVLSDYFAALWPETAVRQELVQLLEALDARSGTRAEPSVLEPEIPLTMHARYSRQEVVAALGFATGVKPKITQGGILWARQARSDVFFIDLRKAERDYSPTTMYRDYAINRELFHWESQSRQSPRQPTVQRYINHQSRHSRVLLFVRERKSFELGTQSFTFLGPATYVEHRGERPVAFTWRLHSPMPENMFEIARSVAAA